MFLMNHICLNCVTYYWILPKYDWVFFNLSITVLTQLHLPKYILIFSKYS